MAWSEDVTRRAALQEILNSFSSIEEAQESVREFTRSGGSGIENYLRQTLTAVRSNGAEADCNETVDTLKAEVAALAAKVAAL